MYWYKEIGPLLESQVKSRTMLLIRTVEVVVLMFKFVSEKRDYGVPLKNTFGYIYVSLPEETSYTKEDQS